MTTESRGYSIVSRMKRAMKLEDSLYGEVEYDPAASRQGLYIIALVSRCQAVGRGLESIIVGRPVGNILVTGTFGFIETVIGRPYGRIFSTSSAARSSRLQLLHKRYGDAQASLAHLESSSSFPL